MIVTRTEFLEMAALDGETLDIWLEEEWLLPHGGRTDPVFAEVDIARAQLIRTLTGDLGVNSEGVGIVLHLMDQIYALRGALKAATGKDLK